MIFSTTAYIVPNGVVWNTQWQPDPDFANWLHFQSPEGAD